MKRPVDLAPAKAGCIIRIRSAAELLRPAERSIADFVLADPAGVIQMSISELGLQAGVGESTIVRFCRTIGYTGYQEFKLRLAQDLVEPSEYIRENISFGDTTAELADKIFQANQRAVEDTRRSIDPAKIEAAAKALTAARKVAAKIDDATLASMPMLAGFRVVPYWTLVRFGRWEEMLKEPAPPASNDFLTGAWHYGRGEALVATGKLDEAKRELAALDTLMKADSLKQPLFSPNTAGAILGVGQPLLSGLLAAAEGRYDAAVAALELAVRREDALVYTEPSEWAYPPRHALARVLLQAGRAAEAETVLWQDLAEHPENGWALHTLAQALRAQHKDALAETVQQRFVKAWKRADIKLADVKPGTALAVAAQR